MKRFLILGFVTVLLAASVASAQVSNPNQARIESLLSQLTYLQTLLAEMLAGGTIQTEPRMTAPARQPLKLITPKDGETLYRGGNTEIRWTAGYLVNATEPEYRDGYDAYIVSVLNPAVRYLIARNMKNRVFYWDIGSNRTFDASGATAVTPPPLPDGQYQFRLCQTNRTDQCQTLPNKVTVATGVSPQAACAKIPCHFDGKAIHNTGGTVDMTPDVVSARYPYEIIVATPQALKLRVHASAYPGKPGDTNTLSIVFDGQLLLSKTYTEFSDEDDTFDLELGLVPAGRHYLKVGAEPYSGHAGLDWFEVKPSNVMTGSSRLPKADLAITKITLVPHKTFYAQTDQVEIRVTIKNLGTIPSGSYDLAYSKNDQDDGGGKGYGSLKPGEEYTDVIGEGLWWTYRGEYGNEFTARLTPQNPNLDSDPLNNVSRLKLKVR